MRLLFAIFICSTGSVLSEEYVWDILKPAQSAVEVQSILTGKHEYPTYNGIPQTTFSCSSKKHLGFYADIDTQCQVFHRCDINGNQTSYLCVNSTVFNQITLVCDYFYNVDCQKFSNYEYFANARLYSDLPLFNTPSHDQTAPLQLVPVPESKAVEVTPMRNMHRAPVISQAKMREDGRK